MRILIIGGGRFLGRAFAAQAVADGHEVTVFNRGRSGVDPEGVRAVRGDRERPEDVERLVAAEAAMAGDGGPTWDAVIDTCGFTPAVVEANARILAGHSRAYLFISSVNAYERWPAQGVRDGSPKWDCGPLETEGRLVWADDEFLMSHGVDEWTGLPAWAAAGSGVWDVASERAADAGLVCRPIEDGARHVGVAT